MDRSDDYTTPNVPPATPPVINDNADPVDAATMAHDDGDSDAPGSRPSDLQRGREDEELQPGGFPDGSRPGRGGDLVNPAAPDEFGPDRGDTIEPDGAPAEAPPQPDTAPLETPPPPD